MDRTLIKGMSGSAKSCVYQSENLFQWQYDFCVNIISHVKCKIGAVAVQSNRFPFSFGWQPFLRTYKFNKQIWWYVNIHCNFKVPIDEYISLSLFIINISW